MSQKWQELWPRCLRSLGHCFEWLTAVFWHDNCLKCKIHIILQSHLIYRERKNAQIIITTCKNGIFYCKFIIIKPETARRHLRIPTYVHV